MRFGERERELSFYVKQWFQILTMVCVTHDKQTVSGGTRTYF
jgi:hypothetical protein